MLAGSPPNLELGVRCRSNIQSNNMFAVEQAY
jgi:hypothetical protein